MVDVFRVSYKIKNLNAISGEEAFKVESETAKSDLVPNSYVVLGLADDADLDQIRARFVQLSTENQKSSAVRSEESVKRRQQKINEAYGILSHPEKKASLDQEIKLGRVATVEKSHNAEEVRARYERFSEFKKEIESISSELNLPDAIDVLCLELNDTREEELLYLIRKKRGEFIFSQIEMAKNLDELPVVNFLRKLYKEKKLTTLDLTGDDGLISRIRNKAHGFIESEISGLKNLDEISLMKTRIQELYDDGQISVLERDDFIEELNKLELI